MSFIVCHRASLDQARTAVMPAGGCRWHSHPVGGCRAMPAGGCRVMPAGGCRVTPAGGCRWHSHPGGGCRAMPAGGFCAMPAGGCRWHSHPVGGCRAMPSQAARLRLRARCGTGTVLVLVGVYCNANNGGRIAEIGHPFHHPCSPSSTTSRTMFASPGKSAIPSFPLAAPGMLDIMPGFACVRAFRPPSPLQPRECLTSQDSLGGGLPF
ncbi:MAG: hypothetical protein LBG81_08530 [Coriobacteriaceae bacterium]|nr:hypothetical protein [Coriobacteriaceae bacterium]